jgi:photosystem II stability/assembly factor-like uncharacterized protein
MSIFTGMSRPPAILPALLAVLCLGALAAAVGAGAATSTTVVTVQVPSAVSLTNNCTNPAGYRFGVVQVNTPATTATGAGVCSFQFSSSNDSSMLRIGQKDGGLGGNAMGLPPVSAIYTGGNFDHLMDLDQYDTNLGWAIGLDGTLLQTTNGSTWTDRTGAASSILAWQWMYAIDVAPGGTTAYAGGDNSTLMRIDAAGTATPTYVDLSARLGWGTADIRGVVAVSASELIVVGSGGRVARSTTANLAAGSVNFTTYTLPTTQTLQDVEVAAANTYYIVGRGAYWKTTNGAVNNVAGDWASTASSGTIFDIATAGAGSLLSGGYGGLLGTGDGTTWTNRTDGNRSQATFDAVALAGSTWPGVGWAAGEYGEIWKTSNGGASWTRLSSPTGNWIRSITALDDQNLVAVGANRLVMRSSDGGATWTKQNYDPSGQSQLSAVDVDPSNGQVAVAVGSSAGAGSQARIRRTTDGAVTWCTVTPPTSNALFGVSFASSSVVWSVGDGGTILRSGDGGLTWSTQSSPSSQRLRSVAARNAYEAWAVGEQGTIVRTVNGGTTWAAISSGTTATLNDVVVTPNGTVVVAGTNGTIRRSTNGGATWSAAASTPSAGVPVLALDASGDSVMYATDMWNWTLWKSVDGGVNWSVAVANTNGEMYGLAVVGDVGFTAGDWGSSGRSGDAGATWTDTSTSGNGMLYGIAAADSHTAYAVGEGGEFQRFVPQTGADALVSNYALNTADWDSGAATNMFGICLQNTNATTSVAPGWTKDVANTSGTCETLDTDPWAAIPTSITKLASTSGAGVTGQVDVVWGARFKGSQTPGDYSAAVVFEALAPNV